MSACEVLEKLPLVTSSSHVKVVYGDANGINFNEECAGATLKLTKTKSTFSIREFQSLTCGTDWKYGVHSFTSKIIFEDEGTFYYDTKGERHSVQVTCSENELRIELGPHPVSWIDPWKPGRWILKVEGDKIHFDWFHPTFEDHYMHVTTTLTKVTRP